jgi:putative transposase
LDNGVKISSPLWYRNALPKLRRLQQQLSRCKQGSKHRRAAKTRLSKLHDKIANQRRDWFYKLAHQLCANYTTICIEDLNMKAMQKLWGRKVSDLAFAEFVQILEGVASKTGGRVVKIDRWLPSSKTCHACGYIYKDLNLKEREWICACCGTHHDRDINAAINIKVAALA